LIELRDWMHASHIPAIHLAYNGRVDPRVYGIDYVPLVQPAPLPLVAISGYYLTGQPRPMMTPRGLSQFTALPFAHELMERDPVAVLGSILVYKRSDLEDAQREWQAKRAAETTQSRAASSTIHREDVQARSAEETQQAKLPTGG
jgi:hypothetical protein